MMMMRREQGMSMTLMIFTSVKRREGGVKCAGYQGIALGNDLEPSCGPARSSQHRFTQSADQTLCLAQFL